MIVVRPPSVGRSSVHHTSSPRTVGNPNRSPERATSVVEMGDGQQACGIVGRLGVRSGDIAASCLMTLWAVTDITAASAHRPVRGHDPWAGRYEGTYGPSRRRLRACGGGHLTRLRDRLGRRLT